LTGGQNLPETDPTLRQHTWCLPESPDLHLRQFTVDTQLRETLAGLVRLEKVELTACHILSRTGTLLHLQEFKLRQWRTEVDHENIEQPLHITSSETLRSISLGGHRNSDAILSALTEEPATFNNLVTLSIELWDSFIAPFVTFLEGCPQLIWGCSLKSRILST
jgi:hypothetical protein